VTTVSDALARRFDRDGRLFVFGNGGTATDAHHIVVEFVHTVIIGKRALPAVSLTNDTAAMTGIARTAEFRVSNGLGEGHRLEHRLVASVQRDVEASAMGAGHDREVVVRDALVATSVAPHRHRVQQQFQLSALDQGPGGGELESHRDHLRVNGVAADADPDRGYPAAVAPPQRRADYCLRQPALMHANAPFLAHQARPVP
jgi:hypothetical protein